MKRYPSAADWWIILLIALGPLICFGIGIYYAWASIDGATYLFLGGIFSIGIVLIFLPCEYTLEEDHLLVRSGLIKKRIRYNSITEIQLSRNPLSAPALSLKRISIRSDTGLTLISPIRREEFITELESRRQNQSPSTPHM